MLGKNKMTKKKRLKIMWIEIGILLGIWFLAGFCSEIRFKTEMEALQSQNNAILMATKQQQKEIEVLKETVRQSNLKLDAYKLSPKARVVSLQQPQIVEKIKIHFGADWMEAVELISRESGLNPGAINKNSGACGLFQFYPCEKMSCSFSDVDCQIDLGKKYIINRYGSAKKALAFHNQNGWY